MAGGGPGAPQEPEGDQHAEDRVGPGQVGILVQHKRNDDRSVEHEIGGVVQAIGRDRDGTRPLHHMPLIGDQRQRRSNRDERNSDSKLGRAGLRTVDQADDRLVADEQRRQGDQDDLDQGSERLRLAVAEAMVGVGRRRGDADTHQNDEAGKQIEAAVRQRSEHRHRGGFDGGPNLQTNERDRHDDTGESGARHQRRPFLTMRLVGVNSAHG